MKKSKGRAQKSVDEGSCFVVVVIEGGGKARRGRRRRNCLTVLEG
jgi:hypothetical protein